MNEEKIKLLIVDDSKIVRRTIADTFRNDIGVHVVGEATSGEAALELIPKVQPDVITLDVNMPGMDGLSALKNLMITNPTPTVMISGLTQEGSNTAFESLRYGAVDFIPKPIVASKDDKKKLMMVISEKVKKAGRVKIEMARYQRLGKKKRKDKSSASMMPCMRIIGMGASMGGYGSVLKVIPSLPCDLEAAVLVIVYMPQEFIKSFVAYLDGNSHITVTEAKDNAFITNGTCYLTSAQNYMTITDDDEGIRLNVEKAPFGVEWEGSINMLLFTLADIMAERAMAVILAGSGKDGVEGAREMLRVGAEVVVQDIHTCMESEMPEEVIKEVSVKKVIPDTTIAQTINQWSQQHNIV
jgi:two-component system chemotaxis response regulator CheB